jgi:tRNA A-37 threonylcarbamoyl transferase component Bud32/FixJ family two-component response regulator
MRPIPAKSKPQAEAPSPASAGAPLGMIVHDDLELRLKVADLLRRAGASQRFDSSTQSAFEAIPLEALQRYAALFLVLEFSGGGTSDPLLTLSRVHDQAPRLPVFVIARGGNERHAVRAIKAGATDYWPIHAVELQEVASALRGIDALKPQQPVERAAEATKPEASSNSGSWRVPGYRIIKRLSESHLSAVYLAEQCDSPMLVAVKLQRIADVSNEHRQRFLRECELLSKLNHRSIADVIDFGVTDEYCFLALEYFPCGSLRDRLRNPVSEAEAMNYALQIGEALHVVHAADIVHRDLKPSNCMLTEDNRLVLIDFGLARSGAASLDITRPNMSVGSPYYVSPEQIEGQEPDTRCDLYSFGAVIYEMLTGQVPFRGKTVPEIIDQHRTAPIPRLPAALKKYQALIDRLLAKKPADRFASAQEVIVSLRTFAATPASRRVDS